MRLLCYRDDWQHVAEELAEDPIMHQAGDQTQGEHHDDLDQVDDDDVGQTEVDALTIQLLFDDEQQDDDVTDETDDGQCNKE